MINDFSALNFHTRVPAGILRSKFWVNFNAPSTRSTGLEDRIIMVGRMVFYFLVFIIYNYARTYNVQSAVRVSIYTYLLYNLISRGKKQYRSVTQ